MSRCKVIVWLSLVDERSVFYKSATFLTINNDCCVNSLDWWPTLNVTGVLAFINITHSVNNKDTVKNVGFCIPLVNALHYRTSLPCLQKQKSTSRSVIKPIFFIIKIFILRYCHHTLIKKIQIPLGSTDIQNTPNISRGSKIKIKSSIAIHSYLHQSCDNTQTSSFQMKIIPSVQPATATNPAACWSLSSIAHKNPQSCDVKRST